MGDATRTPTPPHSDEAEQSVIGAILNDPAAFDMAAQLIGAGDFYRPEYAAMWTTCEALLQAGQPVDPITLHERGGHLPAETTALLLSVPSARNVRAYAEIVRDRATLRQAAAIGGELRADILRGSPDQAGAALIDAAVAKLLALMQRGATGEPRPLPSLLPEWLDELQQRADGTTDAIATGLADLDRLTAGGGRPGELWVIGARPSMGKSALVLTLARHVGQTHRALLLSQEDSLRMLTSRHVAAAGRVNLADLRDPTRAPSSMWEGVAEGVERLRHLHVSMDDQPALTLADVRRKAQQVASRHGALRMLVVDYLQLMTGAGENRNRELADIANGLKRLAKELGCWVVLLSQLNREADKRRPIMSDLRDSGDIEGAADLIGLLYREHRYKPDRADKHLAELEVVKHKNGATDTVRLHFDGAYQRFGNWAGAHDTEDA